MARQKITDGKIECDFCDKPAVANFQRTWVEYRINKHGNYGKSQVRADLQEPIEDDNVHVCEKHEEEWLDDELG